MSYRRLLLALAVVATASAPLAAQTTVLDFEDLTGQGPMPATYGGVNWLGEGWAHYAWEQPPYTAHSGQVRLYRHALTNPFSFVAGPTTFEGAWFAGSTNVQFRLYLDGNLVHTTDGLTLSGTPTFLSSGFNGAVDLVEVQVGSGGHWVMDDVQFSAGHATVTPEPASFALVGLGLAALGGVARRRRRASAE